MMDQNIGELIKFFYKDKLNEIHSLSPVLLLIQLKKIITYVLEPLKMI